MSDYINLDQFKATLELTNQTYADEDAQAAVTAASRAVDDICQRRFYPDADATQVRYYSPRNSMTVMIDDLVTLTSFATDNNGDGTFSATWTLNTDFVLEPLNAAADGRPYTRINTHPLHQTWGMPYWYPRSAKVTGKFGWATVPDNVKEATTIIASQLLKRTREAPFGIVAFGDGAGVARLAVTDPTVRMLLANFQREKPLT